jgi:Na+-driven multidrug efflux pump
MFSIDYLIVPFYFCAHGFLIGAGRTTFTMLNSVVSSVFYRIPLALFFGSYLNMGLAGIGLAAPAATVGALAAAFVYIKVSAPPRRA